VPRLAESLVVLRERQFRFLFYGQAVSVFGDRMVAVALAFAVLEVGGSVSAVGLVLASGAVALAGCLLVGGVIADRTSRRAVMVGADLARLASQGAMAALLIGGAAEVWMLAVLAAISGAATGFFSPASVGLLPTVVDPDQLQQANGLRAFAMSTGEIFGPIAAGALVASAGAGWALGLDAATFCISAVLLSQLRLPATRARRATSFLDELKEGWEAFRSRTWVWSVVAVAAVGNIVWGAWSALGPVIADRDLGGAAAWGAVLAAMGVGALAGSLLATQVNPRRPLIVFALMGAVLSVPLALLAAGVPVPLLAVGALLGGSAMMLGNTVWESALQRHIPGESLSRVSAYDWFGSVAFYPLGLAIWGPVASAVGFGASLWIAAAVMLATTLALLVIPDIRSFSADPAEPDTHPTPLASTWTE
jgi:predicted MFS family arabinose efflux permease